MGWGGDHTAWAFQVPALAAEFDVIALDNRGAGQSDAPDTRYTIPTVEGWIAIPYLLSDEYSSWVPPEWGSEVEKRQLRNALLDALAESP